MKLRRSLVSGVAAAMLAGVAVGISVGGAGAAPSDTAASADAGSPAGSIELPKTHRGGGTAVYHIMFEGDTVPETSIARAGAEGRAPQRLADLPAGQVERMANAIKDTQATRIDRINTLLGHRPNIVGQYQYAANGYSAELTAAEAIRIAEEVPGLESVTLDFERELHTDQGPGLINADELWAGTAINIDGYKGEGVVIGIVDTGIAALNDSFADPAPGDGYDHTNPRGQMYGACNPDHDQFDATYAAMCNDKLIGMYEFGGANAFNPGSPIDADGHGSHTASTAGGNVVNNVTAAGIPATLDISGVAPHANIISYQGCCTGLGLFLSIEQAIIDEVDVINYSIGSTSPSADPWTGLDSALFLQARKAGVFVATSNGNSGPDYATTGSPADVPWVISVGASSHARFNYAELIQVIGSQGAFEIGAGAGVVPGKGSTEPLAGPVDLVYAGDFGDATCEFNADDPDPNLPDNTDNFTGRIVVCDRGAIGRVAKSINVASQGAAGFVLVNDEANNRSLVSDDYAVPGIFVSFDTGDALKQFMADSTEPVTGGIEGTVYQVDDANADILAGFSSRGPNQALDILTPNVTAPGVDVLAAISDGPGSDADGGGNSYDFYSGTSMASPHVAGAGALMTQVLAETDRDWTPAEMQSALMSTASPTVLNHDLEPADPYQQGNGRIDVAAALDAGLLFDITGEEYDAANPLLGGDVKTLNLPSATDTSCVGDCAWSRTATSPLTTAVNWTASAEADPAMDFTVTLGNNGAVPAGGELAIDMTANVVGAEIGTPLFARVTLTPDDPNVPEATIPVAIVPAEIAVPETQTIITGRAAGGHLVAPNETLATDDLQLAVADWVPGTPTEGTLATDPSNGDPFDDLGQVAVHEFEVPAGTSRFVAEITATEIGDADLFVGQGAVSPDNLVCVAATGAALEYCDVANPAAGTYWVLIQNWDSADTSAELPYALSTAVVGSGQGSNSAVEGPTSVGDGEEFDVIASWELPDSTAGERYYSNLFYGKSAAEPAGLGNVALDLHRLPDDVTKTASGAEAVPGDTIDYQVEVQPNLTPIDLTYTIVDTVPDGFVIDESSVAGDGVVDGQSITWEVSMPSQLGAEEPATEPTVLSYSVTVGEDASDGINRNRAAHITDKVGSVELVASADVDVDNPQVIDIITPVDPGRYWDTRPDGTTVDGEHAGTGVLGDGESYTLPVAGRGDVPADAVGVVANLAVISPSDLGYATLYPCGGDVPLASHVNYFGGDVLPNNLVVPLDADGNVCVYTRTGSDFALDVNGFVPAGSELVGITPARYLDTRDTESTFDGESQGGGPTAAGETVTVQVAGRGDVPTDAGSALLNLTVADPAAPGFLTIFPCTGEVPTASTVNYMGDEFRANGVVAELSDDGEVCVYTKSEAEIIIDVAGYVPDGAAGLGGIAPARLLDTRAGEPTVDGESAGEGAPGADGIVEVQVTGRAGVPDTATAAILNLAAVMPEAAGYATIYPCTDEVPTASNLNYIPPAAGATDGVAYVHIPNGTDFIANNAITKLSPEGSVCIYTKASTDLVLDVGGWLE